jgi:ribosome recycling factor
MQDTINDAKKKMDGVIEHTKEEFQGIRSGRANAALLTGVTASYYGTPTPILQLANVNITESRTMVVIPFDKGAIDAIEKGLRDSDLGLNPAREGDHIRVSLPELTGERRAEYVKLAKARAEEAKVSLRGIRHKANDSIEKLQKDKEISEDEAKRGKDEIQKLINKHSDEVDSLLGHKEAEILEV